MYTLLRSACGTTTQTQSTTNLCVMWREDRPAAQPHRGSHAQIKLHTGNRLVPAQGTQLIAQGEIMNEELTKSELYDLAVLADDYADRCDDDQEIVERYSAIRDKLLAKAGIVWRSK